MPITIELPDLSPQSAFKLARWTEILADQELARLPYRIETESHWQLGLRWNLIRDPRVTALCFRAHDALSERGRNRKISVSDLLGGEAADLPQGKRDSGVGGKRRMTTGDDQPKPVILDDFVVKRGRVAGLGFELVCDCRPRLPRIGRAVEWHR